MINPSDQDTMNAMTNYRTRELRKDAARPHRELGPNTDRPSPARETVGSIRKVLGLAIVRAGARLAGISVQARVGAQQ